MKLGWPLEIFLIALYSVRTCGSATECLLKSFSIHLLRSRWASLQTLIKWNYVSSWNLFFFGCDVQAQSCCSLTVLLNETASFAHLAFETRSHIEMRIPFLPSQPRRHVLEPISWFWNNRHCGTNFSKCCSFGCYLLHLKSKYAELLLYLFWLICITQAHPRIEWVKPDWAPGKRIDINILSQEKPKLRYLDFFVSHSSLISSCPF